MNRMNRMNRMNWMNRFDCFNCFRGTRTSAAAVTPTSAAAGTSSAAGTSTSPGPSSPSAAGSSCAAAGSSTAPSLPGSPTSTGSSTSAGPSNPNATADTSTSAAAAGPSNPTAAERGKGPSSSEQLSLDAWYSDANKGREFTTSALSFTFKELEDATENFNPDRLLGQGGFGRVFKGYLSKTKQEVAVKKLDPTRGQGIQEFFAEVSTLDIAKHPNIIKLIGYCAENDERLLVYEYMPLGCLTSHLFDRKPGTEPLDWNTRMQIIDGVARGLEYLHHKLNPCIIYRDLKCSNILLDQGYHVKLSDFGLAREGEILEQIEITGSYGYTAPECEQLGIATVKSDIYSFGVVLLELITGRRAFDITKPSSERLLADWAKPLLEHQYNILDFVDPFLEDQCSFEGLRRALSIAASCIHDDQNSRPTISDVIADMEILFVHKVKALLQL